MIDYELSPELLAQQFKVLACQDASSMDGNPATLPLRSSSWSACKQLDPRSLSKRLSAPTLQRYGPSG